MRLAKAWNEIRNMDLSRSFTGDFEEYFSSDVENCDIAMYTALKLKNRIKASHTPFANQCYCIIHVSQDPFHKYEINILLIKEQP